MFDISEEYKYNIKFNGIICDFIPDIQNKYEHLPEIITGNVIYVCEGEYIPNSWKKRITINKNDIIH